MPKSDIYQFWAAFHQAPEGVSVRFPDLPGCYTSGDTEEEAFVAAREVLEGFIYVMEQDNDPIPSPSSLESILQGLEAGETAWLVFPGKEWGRSAGIINNDEGLKA